MERIINILIYLYQNYPNSNQLSLSRVMKLLYLIEWKYSITYSKKLTDTDWYLSHKGPYLSNLLSIMNDSSNFQLIMVPDNNVQQIVIKFLNRKQKIELNPNTTETINFVINVCKNMNWLELNNLVFSTYPIVNGKIDTFIDLQEMAEEYNKVIS